jgi:hypothetical protein
MERGWGPRADAGRTKTGRGASRKRKRKRVTGMDSFGPWLERLEKRITEKELAEEIPPVRYEDDYDAAQRLLDGADGGR